MVAVAFQEPMAPGLEQTIGEASRLFIGAATLFETCLVISKRVGQDAESRVMELVERLNIKIVPLDLAQVGLAQKAFMRYGKGRHPAKLNFGDCLAYAAAKSRGARLLYVGEDFAQTDLA